MKSISKARLLYQKAIEFYSRGNCKKLLNDFKGAIADFTKAIKYNPDFAEAYYKRANTRIMLDDFNGAILDYNKAIELNPKFAEALNNRAILKSEVGDLEGSKLDFFKAGKFGYMNAFSVKKEYCR